MDAHGAMSVATGLDVYPFTFPHCISTVCQHASAPSSDFAAPACMLCSLVDELNLRCEASQVAGAARGTMLGQLEQENRALREGRDKVHALSSRQEIVFKVLEAPALRFVRH